MNAPIPIFDDVVEEPIEEVFFAFLAVKSSINNGVVRNDILNMSTCIIIDNDDGEYSVCVRARMCACGGEMYVSQTQAKSHQSAIIPKQISCEEGGGMERFWLNLHLLHACLVWWLQ